MSRRISNSGRRHIPNLLSRRRINFTSSPETPRNLERRQEIVVQTIGNINEPLMRTYHRQGITYNVHGQVNVSNDDPLEEDIILISDDQNTTQELAPRSSTPSPPPPPSFSSPPPSLSSQQPEEEIEVSCNICFTTFKDTKNVNSSFVTSIHCNHAVCFKCYVKIILNNSVYKCFCGATSSNFRVYNKDGYVEFKPSGAALNENSIKQHWCELLENNTVNNISADLNYVERLQKELKQMQTELSNLRVRVGHRMTMMDSDYIMLKHKHAVAELDLQKANYDLQEANKKSEELQSTVKMLQDQLDKQVAESQVKFEEFKHCNSDLVLKLQNVMSN
ncbi:IE-2 [Maruca vitrata nucleopolyhedrovirus]|uniref:IE-2 n=1 Tax=Maruca vitrata nucleopolyhedrovirus TaxID=1307954 RepID=A1YRI1_9ABAC|nr:IE-2 [Maruca vitrata nucleopolyhedrovirus]ABM05435.1 IE-2 [Maruca vitrata nucleopolyhedrovirus]